MKRTLNTIITCLLIVIAIYSMISFANVISTNLDAEKEVAEWNMFRAFKSQRTIEGIVEATNIIITDDGNIWEINTCDIPVGQRINVTFDTCGTRSVYDDIIVAVSTQR